MLEDGIKQRDRVCFVVNGDGLGLGLHVDFYNFSRQASSSALGPVCHVESGPIPERGAKHRLLRLFL
jgi:hypothetical protein